MASTAGGCVSFGCQSGDFELQGVPCYAMPTSDIPPAISAYGLDVADLYGCPLYRPHQPQGGGEQQHRLPRSRPC